MILSIIILSLSLVLDGLLSNYFPFMIQELSYFTPLLTLISLFFIYPLLKNDKQYFMLIVLFGIIYDLSYTNLLIWQGLIFLILGFGIKKSYQKVPINIFSTLTICFFLIIFYEMFNGLFIFSFQLFPITLTIYFNKIINSILLNIGYAIILYSLLHRKLKKYNKVSLN